MDTLDKKHSATGFVLFKKNVQIQIQFVLQPSICQPILDRFINQKWTK